MLNSAEDRPWSEHFCCMVAGNREFVRKQQISASATRRPSRGGLSITVSRLDMMTPSKP